MAGVEPVGVSEHPVVLMRAVGLANTHPVAAYHTGGCESLRNGSNRRHQVAVSQNNVSSTAGW
jgi:hypothetical protein